MTVTAGKESVLPTLAYFNCHVVAERRKSQNHSEVLLFSAYRRRLICRATSAALASHLKFPYVKQVQWNSLSWLKQKFCPQIWSIVGITLILISMFPCHPSPTIAEGDLKSRTISENMRRKWKKLSIKEKSSEIPLWSYYTVLVLILFSKFEYFLACSNASKWNMLTHPSACCWLLY